MNSLLRLGSIIIALRVAVASAQGQTAWSFLGTTPNQARLETCYDRVRDRIVTYQGLYGGGTWEFDGTRWAQVLSSQVPGPWPVGSQFVFDQARGVTVLYFRQGTSSIYETWEWDGVNWVQRDAASIPDLRPFTFHAGRGRVVALGYRPGPGPVPLTYDLYEWDGSNWSLLPTVNPPPRRGPLVGTYYYYMCLGYDQRLDKLRLFGKVYCGSPGTPTLAETWEWDAANGWVQVNAGGPVPYVGLSLYFDERRGSMTLLTNTASISMLAYEWDAGQWTLVNGGGTGALIAAQASYDSRRGRAFVTCSNGTQWGYTSTNPATFSLHGSGCPISLGTPSLSPTQPWALPWLGTTMSVDLTGMPTAWAMLVMGFTDQAHGSVPLPFDLTASGMPGCFLRIDPFTAVAVAGSGGAGTTQLIVPNQAQLLGAQFFQQGLVLAPGANAAGVIMSDSARCAVGRLR